MTNLQRTSYDEVPYESNPFAQSHPDRLATVATLLGMNPAPVDRCRVLELGCSAGGNLIPMAETLPESSFLGVDLAQSEIGPGQEVIEGLGLTNIELKRMNILDVDRDLGEFDYLIAHGVYSWVPAEVQDKILDICGQQLAPNGIAYISYNTYPGWHMRAMIRNMMYYHGQQFTDPKMKLKQGRNLLSFMAKSAERENTPYSMLLQSELEMVRRSQDYYLIHEHLEEVNEPVYFHEFAERAAAKGLQYLGEADLRVMMPANFPPEIESVLQVLAADIIHMEQYMDFLRNRMFRQTLLCREHIPLDYRLRSERLGRFHVSSRAKPVSAEPDICSNEYEKFQSPDATTISVNMPLAKAAMLILSEIFPNSTTVDELRKLARQRLGLESAEDANTIALDTQVIGQCLLSAYTSVSSQLVELRLPPPRFILNVTEKPLAAALARHQASQGNKVTNLRHESIHLSDFDRHILRHLDGQRDRDELVEIVVGLLADGTLKLTKDGEAVTDAEKTRELVAQSLEEELQRLASCALLRG